MKRIGRAFLLLLVLTALLISLKKSRSVEASSADAIPVFVIPDNDDFDSAIDLSGVIGSLPVIETDEATVAADDPIVSACGLGQGVATLWYSYESSTDTAIALDTFASDYDTFIAVWTGARGALNPVACNDDAKGTKQSSLAFQAQGEVTYYIEVGQPSVGPSLAGCSVYPIDNIWNSRVDTLSVHPRSDAWINSIGREEGFHMDFGSGTWGGGPVGIPYNVVTGTQAKSTVVFDYDDESDAGPYPIPDNPNIEHGSDHHILMLDQDNCILYELYDASLSNEQWYAGSGAIWNLSSHALRPDGWTSADAAGLPILPGLVRYDEVGAGEINHAIRFTIERTQRAYLWPARHFASSIAEPDTPPMGARLRLKASYNISGFSAEMQVILQAMKEYGIIVADNGSDWFISGAPDERWDNDMLHTLDVLTGNDFEVVDALDLMIDADSGQAAQP